MTLKINRVPDSLKDYICTKFGQNPLKDVDPRVFTRMLRKDGRTDGRKDGSVAISLRSFVGEGIIIPYHTLLSDMYIMVAFKIIDS